MIFDPVKQERANLELLRQANIPESYREFTLSEHWPKFRLDLLGNAAKSWIAERKSFLFVTKPESNFFKAFQKEFVLVFKTTKIYSMDILELYSLLEQKHQTLHDDPEDDSMRDTVLFRDTNSVLFLENFYDGDENFMSTLGRRKLQFFLTTRLQNKGMVFMQSTATLSDCAWYGESFRKVIASMVTENHVRD